MSLCPLGHCGPAPYTALSAFWGPAFTNDCVKCASLCSHNRHHSHYQAQHSAMLHMAGIMYGIECTCATGGIIIDDGFIKSASLHVYGCVLLCTSKCLWTWCILYCACANCCVQLSSQIGFRLVFEAIRLSDCASEADHLHD